MKTVLNKHNVDTLKQPLFLGEDLALQRYDCFKYPKFFELFRQQEEYHWMPEEVSLVKDRNDYKVLSPEERFVFDSNLKFQTMTDSMLSRSIHEIARYVTNPELEICMNTWARFESIHSYSYTYILKNVHNDPSKFFDSILEDDEIVSRAKAISDSYDKLIGTPTDVKQQILDAVISTNITEGLSFYTSFACSFYFGYRGKMEGNAKIIKLIHRDENLHVSITQNILKYLTENTKEGFSDLIKANKHKIVDMYGLAVENEKKWADYLFSRGSLIGLNKDVLGGYAEWLCNNRLQALGYSKLFDIKSNPIGGWLDSFMDSSKVQVAPQETEISSYKIGARDTTIDGSQLADIQL